MALTDFDLEVLLNEAMEDNAVPGEELNKKLKRKVRNKSLMKSFHINIKSVAAVVLVVAAVGAFSQNGTEIKNTTSQLAGGNVTTADVTEQLEKKLNENAAFVPAKKEEKPQNINTSTKSKTKKTEKKETNNNTKKTEEAITDAANSPMVDIAVIEEEQPQVAAFSPDEAVATVENTEEKSYKYLEIAAEGIGKALDELNETVNSYIDSIYNSTEEYPMIANARSGGAGVKADSEKQEVIPQCSYEVICDDEKYLSVCVEVKAPNDGEIHTKCYTVDKENDMLVLEDEKMEKEPTEDNVTESDN